MIEAYTPKALILTEKQKKKQILLKQDKQQ